MSVTQDFLNYILDQLDDVPFVTSKRMFGGAGLWADGFFFGILDENKLYFKVGAPNLADYTSRSMKPISYETTKHGKKKKVKMRFYEVPADIIEDSSELRRWAELAFSPAQ